jgi:hypothetical protein
MELEQIVYANQHLAIIKYLDGSVALVHYCDGKGSDWMPIECLKEVVTQN